MPSPACSGDCSLTAWTVCSYPVYLHQLYFYCIWGPVLNLDWTSPYLTCFIITVFLYPLPVTLRWIQRFTWYLNVSNLFMLYLHLLSFLYTCVYLCYYFQLVLLLYVGVIFIFSLHHVCITFVSLCFVYINQCNWACLSSVCCVSVYSVLLFYLTADTGCLSGLTRLHCNVHQSLFSPHRTEQWRISDTHSRQPHYLPGVPRAC